MSELFQTFTLFLACCIYNIFLLWMGPHVTLLEYVEYSIVIKNSVINLTVPSSQEQILFLFLDTMIYRQGDNLESDLFIKKLKPACLKFSSRTLKKAITSSQLIRAGGTVLDPKQKLAKFLLMKDRFILWAYLINILELMVLEGKTG